MLADERVGRGRMLAGGQDNGFGRGIGRFGCNFSFRGRRCGTGAVSGKLDRSQRGGVLHMH